MMENIQDEQSIQEKVEPKKPKKARSASKRFSLSSAKSSLLEDIQSAKKKKEESDPDNILLSITEEIQAMQDAGLTITEQYNLLKKNGFPIKQTQYKEYVEKMFPTKEDINTQQNSNIQPTYSSGQNL